MDHGRDVRADWRSVALLDIRVSKKQKHRRKQGRCTNDQKGHGTPCTQKRQAHSMERGSEEAGDRVGVHIQIVEGPIYAVER